MTEIQPAHYTQESCHTAQGDRQVLSSLVCEQGRAPGVGGEMVVTAGAGLSVDVADGNAFVEGTEAGWQGMYHVTNDATVNIVLDAADPTDDRIDLIVAQVRDSTYSGTDDDWLITVVTGTPSPAPTAPTVPDNSLILATLTVVAGAGAPSGITLGDFYVACADEGRASAVLGTATTTFTEGVTDYAQWDGSNVLSPAFTVVAGAGGPNQVLLYTGPTRWFVTYAWAKLDDAISGAWSLRVVHFDASVTDLQDTTYTDNDTGRPDREQVSPLLLLSDGDFLTLQVLVAAWTVGTTGELTHQMRVASL